MDAAGGNKKKRDRIGIVLYATYLCLLLASVLVVGRLIQIQVAFTPNPRIERVLTPSVTSTTIEARRGNIYDCEGRLLAISRPVYTLHMDCTVQKDRYASMSNGKELEQAWLAKAKELSAALAKEFPGKTADQYYRQISEGRRKGQKFLSICSGVDYNTYTRVMSFPLFNEGRFKGGVRVDKEYTRGYPYGDLARRTIGFVRSKNSTVGNTHVGIEGKFDETLKGKDGIEWLRVTDYGMAHNNDSIYVDASDGKDIRTTINIDYQDIADKALREQIETDDEIEGGCVILMEVGTGAIKAMVNLLRDPKTGKLEESQNLAVGRLGEPGSVFKITTLMTALEDSIVTSLDDVIPGNNGRIEGYRYETDQHILDYQREHHTKQIPIIYGVKISSNYVFRYLAIKNYENRPKEFLANLQKYKLTEAYDFDVDGMPRPSLPNPDSRYWHKSDLGQVAMGYSVTETPLHIITFYNAIANKGKMMKPYLVDGPQILNERICSKATADTLTRGLKAVTEDGTASRLRTAKVQVAGKTGTSRVVLDNGRYESADGRKKNQGTFVGFFPADDPQYSVITVVYSKLSYRNFYGSQYPAGTVKTIVDKLHDVDPHWRSTIGKTAQK
ncbi:MAG: penicillin-binding protein 2 [Bacteroidales bacterium]|nr:penicillin-binding protein 2 [Bacteroidales bacterium]